MKRLSYIQDARCLKVKLSGQNLKDPPSHVLWSSQVNQSKIRTGHEGSEGE